MMGISRMKQRRQKRMLNCTNANESSGVTIEMQKQTEDDRHLFDETGSEAV
jgi:hypothetical protein